MDRYHLFITLFWCTTIECDYKLILWICKLWKKKRRWLREFGSELTQNTPSSRTGTSHGRLGGEGDFGSELIQNTTFKNIGNSDGGLCVIEWCVETTDVSLEDTVSLNDWPTGSLDVYMIADRSKRLSHEYLKRILPQCITNLNVITNLLSKQFSERTRQTNIYIEKNS